MRVLVKRDPYRLIQNIVTSPACLALLDKRLKELSAPLLVPRQLGDRPPHNPTQKNLVSHVIAYTQVSLTPGAYLGRG